MDGSSDDSARDEGSDCVSSKDSLTAATPRTSLVLVLTGLGGLLFVVGVIALVASDPVNWFGVGLAWFAGVYSLLMARFVGKGKLESRR